ncbi:hypothetical protein FOZ63_026133, partial [Perkinsus olseni]
YRDQVRLLKDPVAAVLGAHVNYHTAAEGFGGNVSFLLERDAEVEDVLSMARTGRQPFFVDHVLSRESQFLALKDVEFVNDDSAPVDPLGRGNHRVNVLATVRSETTVSPAMDRGEREAGALPSRMTVETAHRGRRRSAHTLTELPQRTGDKRSLQRSRSVGALRDDTSKRQRRGSDGHAVWQEWFDEAKENAGRVWDSVSRFGMKLKSSADHLLEEVSRALDSDDEKPHSERSAGLSHPRWQKRHRTASVS